MSTFIDGIAASENIDTSGERIIITGLDITSLVGSVFNYEHKSDLPSQIVGKILKAKKIFSEEDCEDERQSYYWSKCATPFLYVMGELFDDYKESAKDVAGMFRYDSEHKGQSPTDTVGFSIEGAKISKENMDITRSIARKVTITVLPANKAAVAEMVPVAGQEKDSLDEIFKTEHTTEINVFSRQNTSKLLEMLKKEDPDKHAKILGIDSMKKTQFPDAPKAPDASKAPKGAALHVVPKKEAASKLGSTKSGKDVHSHKKVHEYENFSAQDHRDAATLHHDAAKGAKSPGAGAHHWDKSRLHQSAANSAMDREQRLKKTEDNSFYHNGDKVRYTGNKEHKHGAEWHEIEHLEGHKKGQKSITSRKPGESMSEVQKENAALSNKPKIKTPQIVPIKKALTAGSGLGVAPSNMTQGAALGKENLNPSMQNVSRPDKGAGAIIHKPPKPQQNSGPGKIIYKKEKNLWLKRAESLYDKWNKKEEFRNFMQKKLPSLALGEIDAIGKTLSLKNSLEKEPRENPFSEFNEVPMGSTINKALKFGTPEEQTAVASAMAERAKNPPKKAAPYKKPPEVKEPFESEVSHTKPYGSEGKYEIVHLKSGHELHGHPAGKFKTGDKVSVKPYLMGTHLMEHKK